MGELPDLKKMAEKDSVNPRRAMEHSRYGASFAGTLAAIPQVAAYDGPQVGAYGSAFHERTSYHGPAAHAGCHGGYGGYGAGYGYPAGYSGSYGSGFQGASAGYSGSYGSGFQGAYGGPRVQQVHGGQVYGGVQSVVQSPELIQ